MASRAQVGSPASPCNCRRAYGQGSADETVRLWHLTAVLEAAGDSQVPCPQSASPAATERCGAEYGGCVKCCAFNNSGSLLACGSADNLVLLIVLPRCICRRV